MGSGNSKYDIGGGAAGGRTRGSLDGGYKGGADHHHAVDENLADVKEHYLFEEGYFGEEASSEDKRHIYSDDPLATAHDFYDRIGYGGIEEPLPARGGEKSKGVRTTMSDGTVISVRDVSDSDGTPAVDISIRRGTGPVGVKKQKIHFEKSKEGK